jgi:hypothetical protein
MGHAVAQWLRHYATNRKVAGSIPEVVVGVFLFISPFRPLYGPGVDSISNRNDYQIYFLGVPTVNETGWAPGEIWRSARKLATTGIRSPDRPPRSQYNDPTNAQLTDKSLYCPHMF